MKKILLLTICYLAVNVAYSQSDKQLTHYMLDNTSFNPGATGYKGYCATLGFREQWTGVNDSPRNFLMNLEGNMQKMNAGVGLSVVSDRIGFLNTLDLKASYAQHLYFPGIGAILSPGVAVGLNSMSFAPDWLAPETGVVLGLDKDLPGITSAAGLDVNFGLFWRGTQVPYYIGVSATHLMQPYLEEVNFKRARHHYVTGGMDINYSILSVHPDVTFKPSFLVINDGVTTSFDITLLVDYSLSPSTHLYGGASVRRKDAVSILLGFGSERSNANNGGALSKPNATTVPDSWVAGYAYDVTTSGVNTYSTGSHELFFKYCMFPPDPTKARHGNVFILQ